MAYDTRCNEFEENSCSDGYGPPDCHLDKWIECEQVPKLENCRMVPQKNCTQVPVETSTKVSKQGDKKPGICILDVLGIIC